MNMTPDDIRTAQKASWDKFSGGWAKWDEAVLAMLGPTGDKMIELLNVRDDTRHLDIAAGTGEPGLTIAARAPKGKVTVTDLSPRMLEVAQKNAAARGLSNVEFREADASALPFEDAQFDSVTARFGFMFFPDVDAAAREMARVLKPGGKVAASVWVAPEDNPWIVVPVGVINAETGAEPPPPGAPGMFRCAAPGYLAKLFEAAGLTDTADYEVLAEQRLESAAKAWEMMTEVAAPVVAGLDALDEAGRERVRTSVIEKLSAFESADGYRVPVHSRVTVATKAG